jgi:hypothetical protein
MAVARRVLDGEHRDGLPGAGAGAAARGQRIHAAFSAPGQVAAQVRFSVLPGGAGEAGQVGSHCQEQLVSERRWLTGGDERQVCEAHHAQTRRPDSGSHETSRTRQMRQLRTFTSSTAGNYALWRALIWEAGENRAGHPVTAFPVLRPAAHPAATQSSCQRPASAGRRGSASRFGAQSTRPAARDVSRPGPRGSAPCCRGHRVPAFQRRSLWLDQASASRALAVAPRGSSDASTTARMSYRCSPEPSARSRQLPGAAA